jgi:hypothetical protein
VSHHPRTEGLGQLGNEAGRGLYLQTVLAIDPSPSSTQVVHIRDRGADLFKFLHTCRETRTHFVVRAAQDRRVQTEDEHLTHLFELVRALASQDQRPLQVPAGHGRKARTTSVQGSFTPLRVLPPRHDARLNKLAPLPVWVIRVWQEQMPEGEEPLE